MPTIAELKEICKRRGLTGYHKLKKADLILLCSEPVSESKITSDKKRSNTIKYPWDFFDNKELEDGSELPVDHAKFIVAHVFNWRTQIKRVDNLQRWLLNAIAKRASRQPVWMNPHKVEVVSTFTMGRKWYVWSANDEAPRLSLEWRSSMDRETISDHTNKAWSNIKEHSNDNESLLILDINQHIWDQPGNEQVQHANSVVIDLARNRGYYFEPMILYEDDKDGYVAAGTVQKLIKHKLNKILPDVKWEPPVDCPALQRDDAATCQSWSFFYIVMRVINPTVPENELLESMRSQERLTKFLWFLWRMPFDYQNTRGTLYEKRIMSKLYQDKILIHDRDLDNVAGHFGPEHQKYLADRGEISWDLVP